MDNSIFPMVVITHYSNVFMEMANFVQAVATRRGREELRKLGGSLGSPEASRIDLLRDK